ncbi:MAG: hypothetical protein H3C27_06320 [Opitutaceae bacterium]|nr:hypothetical protein [Opitutaceae bacterium]
MAAPASTPVRPNLVARITDGQPVFMTGCYSGPVVCLGHLRDDWRQISPRPGTRD